MVSFLIFEMKSFTKMSPTPITIPKKLHTAIIIPRFGLVLSKGTLTGSITVNTGVSSFTLIF